MAKKKYRKVGQTDHYEEIKDNDGCAKLLGGIIILIVVFALLSQCGEM